MLWKSLRFSKFRMCRVLWRADVTHLTRQSGCHLTFKYRYGDGPVKSVREGRESTIVVTLCREVLYEVLVMRRSTLNFTLQQLQPLRLVVTSTSTTTIATSDSTVNPPPAIQNLFTKDCRNNCNNVGGQTKVSFLTTLVFSHSALLYRKHIEYRDTG